PTSPFAAATSGIQSNASNGMPVGTHGDDSTILDPNATPSSFTATERERYIGLLSVMDTVALDAARVVAHEIGHSVGLIEDGNPGAGMYGGVATYTGSTSGHVKLDSYFMGNGQNVMSPSGGLLNSHSRFTAFNKLAWAYMVHRCVVN
ncbi:MAG: hypothetical protein KDB07_08540, partial [Planctomycetes bacterium]|nr:hypothetical protein [Planctomycetota bacterium]